MSEVHLRMRTAVAAAMTLAIVTLACDSTSESGRVLPTERHRALLRAREDVWRAYFEGDSVKLARLLPVRMVGMDRSRDAIIGDALNYAKNGGQFVGITFTDDEFYIRGTVAVVYSRYRLQLQEGAQVRTTTGKAMELFEWVDGQWVNPSWFLRDDPPVATSP